MLIESDLLIAYLKKTDWLKSLATKTVRAIETGELKKVVASSAVLHEMYYVLSEHASLETILADFARVTTIANLTFVNPGTETYLSAIHLAKTHGITSVFDALYAATALSESVSDHAIISTDSVFDKIPGLKRISPEELPLGDVAHGSQP